MICRSALTEQMVTIILFSQVEKEKKNLSTVTHWSLHLVGISLSFFSQSVHRNKCVFGRVKNHVKEPELISESGTIGMLKTWKWVRFSYNKKKIIHYIIVEHYGAKLGWWTKTKQQNISSCKNKLIWPLHMIRLKISVCTFSLRSMFLIWTVGSWSFFCWWNKNNNTEKVVTKKTNLMKIWFEIYG